MSFPVLRNTLWVYTRLGNFLNRRLEGVQRNDDDHASEQWLEQLAEFRLRIARDYGFHRHLALYQENDPNNIQRLSESIQLYPEAWDYLHSRSNVYWGSGEFDLALADISRAIELAPPFMLDHEHGIKMFANRGDLYTERGGVR